MILLAPAPGPQKTKALYLHQHLYPYLYLYFYMYFYLYFYLGRLVNIQCQSLPTLRLLTLGRNYLKSNSLNMCIYIYIWHPYLYLYFYMYFYPHFYLGRLVNIQCQSLPTLRLGRANAWLKALRSIYSSLLRLLVAFFAPIQLTFKAKLLTSDKLMISLANGSSSTHMPSRSSRLSKFWSQSFLAFPL